MKFPTGENEGLFGTVISYVEEVPEKVAGLVGNQIKTTFTDAGSSVLEDLAKKIVDGVGEVVVALGTIWMDVPTVKLTADRTKDGVFDPSTDPIPNVETGVETFLGYAKYIALGICVLAVMFAGVRMATHRRTDSGEHGNRLGIILGAVILLSAGTGLITQIAIKNYTDGSPTVNFVRDQLNYFTLAIALLSIIIAAAKMAWEQRADAGRDLTRSILTLITVSGCSLTVISLLTQTADLAAKEIIQASLANQCDDGDDRANCFGDSLLTLLAFTGVNNSVMLVIILSTGALIASLVQAVLMVIRSGVLVVLAGTLPLSAAATNTDAGRTMFRKTIGWIVAFILYKPAAAIIYAAAFRLTSSDITKDGGLISSITGLTLMVTSIIALPALLKLVVPAIGGMGGGSETGAATLGKSREAMPTGAKPRSSPRTNSSPPPGAKASSPKSTGGSPSGAKVAAGAVAKAGSSTATGAKAGSAAGPLGTAAGAAAGATVGAAKSARTAANTAAQPVTGAKE